MSRPVPIRSKRLSDYWLEFYTNKRLCSLCANTGVIDTTGLKTVSGVEVGKKNFCICPNGQAIRKHEVEVSGDRNVQVQER